MIESSLETLTNRIVYVAHRYLVLSLASKSLISNKNVDTGFSFLQANFSDRLIHAVNNLLTGSHAYETIEDIL